MKIGDVFRLKGLYNVRVEKKGDAIVGAYEGEKLIPETAKIQWTTDDNITMNLYKPRLLFLKEKFN